jgi:hypothetical protein
MINRRSALVWTRSSLLRKGVSALLITSLAVTTCWAKSSKTPKPPPDAHQQVKKLGLGAKVDIMLVDGTLKQGKIKAFDDQSVTVDGGKKNGGVSTIPYESVKLVHRSGLSTGAQVGILVAVGVGVAVGVVAVIAAVSLSHF